MLKQKQNPHGGDIYKTQVVLDFSANTSPLGTPQTVKDAIIGSIDSLANYPDPYCTALVNSLAIHHNIPSQNIVCTNGAAELIYAFVGAIRPKRALVLSPTFCEYEEALNLHNCEVVHYILNEENNFSIDKGLLNTIDEDFDAIFICNPNNPTGVLYDEEILLKIAHYCFVNCIFLFLDECFLDLSDKFNSSLINVATENPYVFVLKAFTKSYGMAGVRLGYGISSNYELLELLSLQTQVWNVSTIAQVAGVAALTDTNHIKKSRSLIKQQREYLVTELTKISIKVFTSNVNFLLIKTNFPLYEKLLSKGIMIRKCGNFTGLDNSYYRIAVKTRIENEQLINALKNVLQEV